MANFNWKTGTNGDWNLAGNWTEGLIPNDPAAAVTIVRRQVIWDN